jgi:hypothetical protein
MSGNVIKKAIPVGKIVKFGVEIACEVATETTEWTRPSGVAAAHGPALKEAVEKSTKPLPPKTKKLISRCVLSKHPHSLGFRLTMIIVRAITKAMGTRKTTSLLSHMMQMAIGSKPSILTPLRRSKHSLHSLGCSVGFAGKCCFWVDMKRRRKCIFDISGIAAFGLWLGAR